MHTELQAKLCELAVFETTAQFEDGLGQLAERVADALGAGRVSIMLLDIGRAGGARLRLKAAHGELPAAAWKEEPTPGQGLAGQVLQSGKPLLLRDIHDSQWRHLARSAGTPGACMLSPIPLAGQPGGVLNISEPLAQASFTEDDLHTAELAATLLGRAIQVMQLTRLLDSRFAQMAFSLENSGETSKVLSLTAHEPEKVARMLAKAFYKEMRRCGFTSGQVVHAAGEIISELTGSLNRHKRRIAREG